jgi:hypothetical protein
MTESRFTEAHEQALRQAVERLRGTSRYKALQRRKALLCMCGIRLEGINERDADYPKDERTPTPEPIRLYLLRLAKQYEVERKPTKWRDPVAALEALHAIQAHVQRALVDMRYRAGSLSEVPGEDDEAEKDGESEP